MFFEEPKLARLSKPLVTQDPRSGRDIVDYESSTDIDFHITHFQIVDSSEDYIGYGDGVSYPDGTVLFKVWASDWINSVSPRSVEVLGSSSVHDIIRIFGEDGSVIETGKASGYGYMKYGASGEQVAQAIYVQVK